MKTALFDALLTAGTGYGGFRIELGNGHRTPDGSETALVAPYSPAKSQLVSELVIDGDTRAIDWTDLTLANAYADVSEIGVFVTPAGGSEILADYDSVATGVIPGLVKTAQQSLIFRIFTTFTEQDLTNATVSIASLAKATQAQAEAGTDNSAYMTPLRTEQAIDALARVRAVTILPASPAVNDVILYAGPVRTQTGWAAAIAKPTGAGTLEGIDFKSNGDLVALFDNGSLAGIYTRSNNAWGAVLNGPAGYASVYDLAVNPVNDNISIAVYSSVADYRLFTHDGSAWDAGVAQPRGVSTAGIAYDDNGSLYAGYNGEVWKRVGNAWVKVVDSITYGSYALAVDPAGLLVSRHGSSRTSIAKWQYGRWGGQPVSDMGNNMEGIAYIPLNGGLAVGLETSVILIATYDNAALPDDTGWLRYNGNIWVRAA